MDELINTKQAAKILGITEAGLYRLMSARALPYIKLGHRTARFRKADLDALISARTVAPYSPVSVAKRGA